MLSKAILPTTQKTGEATLKKCSLLGKRVQDQLVRLAKFIDPSLELNQKLGDAAITEMVNTVTESLVNNTDIVLDKIERFKELKKKYNFKAQPVNQSSNNANLSDFAVNRKIENSVDRPFIPKILTKPNSTIPLPDTIVKANENADKFFENEPNASTFEFPHPYSKEIESLDINDAQKKFSLIDKVLFTKNPGSNFSYVDNESGLYAMIDELKKQHLIAVDLEYHSERSFLGFTCLMQISTPERDYIVDTISLKDKLYMLNISFTNPSILKILHGSDMDIKWLQKDFGVYVVNMLDTYRLARRFNQKSNSLASLLQYTNQSLP